MGTYHCRIWFTSSAAGSNFCWKLSFYRVSLLPYESIHACFSNIATHSIRCLLWPKSRIPRCFKEVRNLTIPVCCTLTSSRMLFPMLRTSLLSFLRFAVPDISASLIKNDLETVWPLVFRFPFSSASQIWSPAPTHLLSDDPSKYHPYSLKYCTLHSSFHVFTIRGEWKIGCSLVGTKLQNSESCQPNFSRTLGD